MNARMVRGAASVSALSWRLTFRWDGWGAGVPVGHVGHVSLERVPR